MEENTSKVFVGRSAAALVDPLPGAVPSTEPASTLFIINLCSSIAPVQTAGKTIPGFESHKLYQVARAEDGRTRHRLRLGFFTSEADAEQALIAVRDNYPTAFVACLSDDDRRFARGYLPNTETTAAWKRPVLVPKPAAVAPAEPPKAPPVPAAAAPKAAPIAAKEVAKHVPKPEAPVAKAPPAVAPPAKSAPPAPAAARSLPPVTVAAAAPVAKKPEPVAPAPEESAIDLHWEPESKPTAAVAAPARLANEAEIELSWDLPELSSPKQAANELAPQTIAPVYKTETVIKAPAQKPDPSRPAATVKKPAAPPTEEVRLTLEKEPQQAKPAPSTASGSPAQPFHVGKGVEIPTSALSLEATARHPAPVVPEKPASKAAPAAAAPTKEPARSVAAKSEPARKAPETKAAPAPIAAAPRASVGAPELDSTQTIRALTSAELNDDSPEKWFSIQLVVSERPVNLDAMPHLDIFEAYRVYSIANAGSGKIVYSLRLGFFREEVSAEAVTGYLRTFFPSPTVIRISTAEQTRFKDAPAPKATAAQAEGKVIELNHARDRKPTIPTVTMAVTDRSPTGAFNPNATGAFNPNATGSFKAGASGTFKSGATGTFKPGSTGAFKVDASGKHKTLKPAAKSAAHATRRSAPMSRTSSTGRYKALPKRSLSEQLLDEARDVQLSESAIRKLPKNDSLLSRLVDKLTK